MNLFSEMQDLPVPLTQTVTILSDPMSKKFDDEDDKVRL